MLAGPPEKNLAPVQQPNLARYTRQIGLLNRPFSVCHTRWAENFCPPCRGVDVSYRSHPPGPPRERNARLLADAAADHFTLAQGSVRAPLRNYLAELTPVGCEICQVVPTLKGRLEVSLANQRRHL